MFKTRSIEILQNNFKYFFLILGICGRFILNKSYILKLIVDNRERKLIELLDENKTKFDYETKQLESGDIIISEDVAIERKTGLDFISSIIDGRLFPQLIRLLDIYASPILVLESFNDDILENTGMELSSIYGALAYISYKLGIAIIPSRNLEDTLIIIERIAYREQIEDVKPVLSRKVPKGMTIEDKRAFMLEGLVDTGPKKSRLLIDKFDTPYQVFKAIKETEITYTKTGNPKGIEGPLKNLPGFGWKFVQKNKTLIVGN